jgi:hypothetical protein
MRPFDGKVSQAYKCRAFAANLKRNARLRRFNGPRAEAGEDVDFVYEDGE